MRPLKSASVAFFDSGEEVRPCAGGTGEAHKRSKRGRSQRMGLPALNHNCTGFTRSICWRVSWASVDEKKWFFSAPSAASVA
jgi:hypothetical protein